MNRNKKRRNKKLAIKDIKKTVSIQASSTIPVEHEQTLTIQQATNLAIKNHQAGNLPKAESIYQQILKVDPNQTDALHYLGLIAHQVGENDRAVKLISDALKIKPDYAEAHCNLGLTLKDLGQLNDAVASYNKALAIKPDFALAYSNKGIALKALGQLDEAVSSYRKALNINPNYAEAYSNLGNAFQELGKFHEAVESFNKSITLKPNYAEAYSNLGNVLRELGRLDESLSNSRKALILKPDYAKAHNNLGNALQGLGRLDEALASYNKALAINPNYAEAHSNLGNALQEIGKFTEAVESLNKALAIKPDYAEAYSNLGNVLRELGQLDEAVSSYNKALTINPNYAEAHSNLGNAFQELGQLDKAVASFNKALVIKPDYADAHYNLGIALQEQGNLDDSVASYSKALSIKPNDVDIHNNLGTVFQNLGRLDEALSSYQKALIVDPDNYKSIKNRLYALLNVPGRTHTELFNEYEKFAKTQTFGVVRQTENWSNHASPNRQLRIGYMSSDLRHHPVGLMASALISCHDKTQFDIFCYSDVTLADEITEKIRSDTDHWRPISGITDIDVAHKIRADNIDILICLAGGFDKNRPLVCAHRAAPVQVSLHDGATSGLEEMDYFLTDNYLHPADTKEMFTEELHRIPSLFQWPHIQGAAEISAPPVDQAGFVTFGSFNNPAKINNEVIRLWAEVLKSVSGSRLLLKYKNWYKEVSLKERLIDEFAACGVKKDCIEFITSLDTRAEHLRLYSKVDIALDPFPFSGATTTFEALWMGVPVVTLAGKTFISRMSGSMLQHVGLGDLALDTQQAYVASANKLARDHARLRTLKKNLREFVKASPICDPLAYSLSVEDAYRSMWKTWCAERKKM
jgi:protein O-GlcNAc transferase